LFPQGGYFCSRKCAAEAAADGYKGTVHTNYERPLLCTLTKYFYLLVMVGGGISAFMAADYFSLFVIMLLFYIGTFL
jgi:hypothetical protein